jgi:hypothetical protein
MKKITLLLQGAVALLLVGLCSCQKSFQNPSSDYEITQITNMGYPIAATITYDGLGNPVDLKYAGQAVQSYHRLFRYDKEHRLSDYISPYDNGFYVFWHRYHYDHRGLIDVDTMYRDGNMAEDPHPTGHPSETELIYYTYDGNGRITDARTYMAGQLVWERTYQYDQNGNRVMSGVTYDHKSSVYRTNKVWMFLNQNYSLNNPIAAVSYNKVGLPLQFNSLPTEDYPEGVYSFLDGTLDQATITYTRR